MYIVWNFWVCDFGLHLWHRHQASWNAAHFVGRLANRDPSRRSDVIRACRMRNTDFDSEGIGIEGGGRLCEYPVWQPGDMNVFPFLGETLETPFLNGIPETRFFLDLRGHRMGRLKPQILELWIRLFLSASAFICSSPHRRVSASQRLQDFVEDWLNNKHQCNNGRGYTVFQNMVI